MTVHVALAELRDLREKIFETSVELDQISCMFDVDLDGSPGVAEGYREFAGDWDERRGSLAGSLCSVAEALKMIDDSFVEADQKLVESLESEEATEGTD